MLKRFDVNKMTYQPKNEEGKFECLIPIYQDGKLNVEVRCEEDVLISLVTGDGEFIPLETGKIVRWSGKVENCSAVQIAANTGFWHLCQMQGGWFEKVDPTPMAVEMVVTEQDVIRNMIEERLKQYLVAEKINRPLLDWEEDELILDIARGDLEFENEPDEFGLGYEERLAEFNRPPAEPLEGAPAPAPAPGGGGQPNPAPEGGNSSST